MHQGVIMRAPLVLASCLLLVSSAPSLAEPPTALERQRLVAHLEMTRGWLVDEVSGLTPAQLTFRREADEWSVAEVLDHLLVVAPIYWKDLQSALATPTRGESNTTDGEMLWYGIDRTMREKAIPGEVPKASTLNVREALAEHRRHHERLVAFIRTTDADLRAHIVPRQGCDAYQWALLISAHEQRHILQIREIKAHARFPRRGAD
jgi:hypothetical protein